MSHGKRDAHRPRAEKFEPHSLNAAVSMRSDVFVPCARVERSCGYAESALGRLIASVTRTVRAVQIRSPTDQLFSFRDRKSFKL